MILNTDSTTKPREVFQCLTKKGSYWYRKIHLKKEADIEYPCKHGEVINYTLYGVSIYPVTTKIQGSFLTQLPERKETTQGFHHEANGDFKTVTEVNGYDMRNLRMDQHCSYYTILNLMKRRKPKHASCLEYGTQVKLKKCG